MNTPTVTPSGREALCRILTYLRPRPNDDVWISTTLGARNLHVSPCVTATIARYCRFSFAPGPRTVAALVIHDFGVPHPQLAAILASCRRHGWPVIEDAAHAFASTDEAGRPVGTLADYALFSLPKFFAMRRGGMVVGLPHGHAGPDDAAVVDELAVEQPKSAAIAEARRRNWHALDSALATVGLGSALPLTPGSVPSLYVLRTRRQFATLRRLRTAGIESGPDVHCGRVLLPCHQRIGPSDVALMAALAGAESRPSSRQDEGVPARSGRTLTLLPGPAL